VHALCDACAQILGLSSVEQGGLFSELANAAVESAGSSYLSRSVSRRLRSAKSFPGWKSDISTAVAPAFRPAQASLQRDYPGRVSRLFKWKHSASTTRGSTDLR